MAKFAPRWLSIVCLALLLSNFGAALTYQHVNSNTAFVSEGEQSRASATPLRGNPEAKMDVIQVLAYHGYPGERHVVTTQDGYIIEMHRIPHGINGTYATNNATRPVVFLTHCLLCSSDIWVSNLPHQSLADQGYDVWLGNVRGNTYGRKHVSLSVNSVDFWRFSWDHHGLDDMPAQVDHILANTGQPQILFVGHSQGAMAAFGGISMNATLRSKIKAFAGLAPTAYLGNMKSPLLTRLEKHTKILQWLMKVFGMKQFMPNEWFIKAIANDICEKFHVGEEICENGVFIVGGFDKDLFNMSRLDVYLDHTPAGTSVQNIIHYTQAVRSGQFQMFDYGTSRENTKHYGRAIPPFYYLSNVTMPVALYHANGDWFSTPPDVALLKRDLPNCVVDYTIPIDKFSHLDFVWGVDANRLVYDKVLDFLQQYR